MSPTPGTPGSWRSAAGGRLQPGDPHIIIPVYGQQQLTHDALRDLAGQAADIVIVDNGGDYEPLADEDVLRPGRNMGWLYGTLTGIQARPDAELYVCLNNDVRPSRGFLGGLVEAWQARPDAGVIAPAYDDVWTHQHPTWTGPAAHYRPAPVERDVPFVDGTCLTFAAATLRTIGALDDQHFGDYGWGADLDYCLRARQAGLSVLVTHRAYLNHLGRRTVSAMPGWFGKAQAEMDAGMTTKYGADWKRLCGLES